MTTYETDIKDRYGREIHVGDIVFANFPWGFHRVESFSAWSSDSGHTFVKLEGQVEPALPSCCEVTCEDDLDDPRWYGRMEFCNFDPHKEWDAFWARQATAS